MPKPKWDKWWSVELRYEEAMRTDGQKHPTVMTLHICGVTELITEALKAGVKMSELQTKFATLSAEWEKDRWAQEVFDTALAGRKP